MLIIEFTKNGFAHALRKWPIVPRIREKVMLIDGQYVVKDVIYGSHRTLNGDNDVCAYIEIEKI